MQRGYPSWQNEALTIIRLVFLVSPRATLLQSSGNKRPGLERAAGRKSNGPLELRPGRVLPQEVEEACGR
jgi:hypothetical protein